MKQVTRDIDPSQASDLLVRVPRACLSFASDAGPLVCPTRLLVQNGHYLIGIPENVDYQPHADQEAVLLVDEGVYYFDLRAVYIRGHVNQAHAHQGEAAGWIWYELEPQKTVAWDYGSLREVKDVP